MNIENILITSRDEIMNAAFYHNELDCTENLTFVTSNGHKIHTQNSVLSKQIFQRRITKYTFLNSDLLIV